MSTELTTDMSSYMQ